MNEEKDTSLSELDKDVVSSDDVLAVVSGNQDAINEQMEKAKELAQAGIDADLAGLSIDQQKKIMDERRKKAEELAAEERRKAEELARQEALKNSPAEKKRLAKEAKQKAKEEAKKAKEEAKKAKEEARKQKELARKNKGKVEDVKNEKVAEVKPSVATTSVTPMPSTTNVTPAVVTPNVTATASNSVTSTPSTTTNVTSAVVTPNVTTTASNSVTSTPSTTTNVTSAVVTPNVTTTASNSVTPTPSKTNVTPAVATPNVVTTASKSVTPTPSTTNVTPAVATPNVTTTASNSVTPTPSKTNVTPAVVTPNVTTIASKSETSPSATTFTTTNTSTEKVSDTGKEVSDSDKKSGKKTSNLKMYLSFIFLALLILMIVFLPEINTFVHDFFNKKEAENTPSITSGHLICTLETNDSNFNYEYETDFSFKDSKLYKLTLTTKTVGDLNLDATDLSGLNASCQLLQFQTSKFDGVEVMCDLAGNTFTNTQTLDYEILNRDEVTTAYLEAGGIYPDYKYEENIDDIEKDMNAQNYSCARYED